MGNRFFVFIRFTQTYITSTHILTIMSNCAAKEDAASIERQQKLKTGLLELCMTAPSKVIMKSYNEVPVASHCPPTELFSKCSISQGNPCDTGCDTGRNNVIYQRQAYTVREPYTSTIKVPKKVSCTVRKSRWVNEKYMRTSYKLHKVEVPCTRKVRKHYSVPSCKTVMVPQQVTKYRCVTKYHKVPYVPAPQLNNIEETYDNDYHHGHCGHCHDGDSSSSSSSSTEKCDTVVCEEPQECGYTNCGETFHRVNYGTTHSKCEEKPGFFKRLFSKH